MVRVEEEERFRIVSSSSHDYNSGPKRVGEDEDVDSSNDDMADIRLGKRKQLDSLAKQDDLAKERSDDRDANKNKGLGNLKTEPTIQIMPTPMEDLKGINLQVKLNPRIVRKAIRSQKYEDCMNFEGEEHEEEDYVSGTQEHEEELIEEELRFTKEAGRRRRQDQTPASPPLLRQQLHLVLVIIIPSRLGLPCPIPPPPAITSFTASGPLTESGIAVSTSPTKNAPPVLVSAEIGKQTMSSGDKVISVPSKFAVLDAIGLNMEVGSVPETTALPVATGDGLPDEVTVECAMLDMESVSDSTVVPQSPSTPIPVHDGKKGGGKGGGNVPAKGGGEKGGRKHKR
ncbi:hypothetical protein RHSIM_Rhsim01G0117600 [Rhododendron simsii]|uniref:Uncharacterized protein n=1 Tax=Rhododendron simsii TaxID=118357 RepID=A0A834HGU9_RHOSS|nr:hypothetical protein RHSIM_Rhsim01G0117600 [Rhododendron simsii]